MSTTLLSGIVKQVLSGDTISIRDKPKNRCPNVKTIVLMSVTAPKLGRKKKDGEEKDEPFAWEAREFLRKKLIGQEVKFFSKPFPNSTNNSNDRELGKIYFPTKDNDIAEELLINGLVKLKKELSSRQTQDPEIKKLVECEEKAKNEAKGIWSKDKEKHIRNVKYIKDGFQNFVSEHGKKPIQAIVEQVRDSVVMMILEVLLLPNFYSVPLAISGIKFPDNDFKDEAKFFIECRLLQQEDIQVVIEKSCNNYVAGSVIHPKGNIAELLLKEGFARCHDQTMITVTTGAAKLRAAEAYAKEKRLRIWKNQQIPLTPKLAKKEFRGNVCEIIGGEALIVKICNTGETKKIFLASIRSPKDTQQTRKDGDDDSATKDKPRTVRTIFDVPWLFEAREFLRKKLIGKRVNIIVDYVQPAKDGFPEKTCCSIVIGGNNVAEEMVLNGLATVIRHSDEDNRSSHYDALLAAEQKAMENHKGVHSKGDPPKYRVNDCTGNRAAGLFPMLQKANRIKAIVEYVFSGARLRIYIPKDSLMITFLLSGIFCPRAGSGASKGGRVVQAEPFGEEALNFTKEKVLQREVEIQIEQQDKKGNMIGSLFCGPLNLALALVEEGLASVHIPSADRSLITAEKVAKEKKLKMWQNIQEEKTETNDENTVERSLNYKEIFITSVTPELHVYVLHVDQKPSLDELQEKMRKELSTNPPATFSKGLPPLKGKLYAAKFDNEWYRGKIEKVIGGSSCKAIVNYIDYGNKDTVLFEDLAPLPDFCLSAKPFAHEYGLAFIMKPLDEYLEDVVPELFRELENRTLRMNVEYYEHNLPYISLIDNETEEDCIKKCISKGFFYVHNRKEKKFRALLDGYFEAQAEAQKKRLFIWEYGDAREDDAKEFGLGKS